MIARTPSAGEGFKHRKVRRNGSPEWTVAREDGDCWAESGGVVQRAGVDGVRIVFAYLPSEHKPAANRTEVSHGDIAIGGLGRELSTLAGDSHRAAQESDERNETRA
jgi:hypothetical protein